MSWIYFCFHYVWYVAERLRCVGQTGQDRTPTEDDLKPRLQAQIDPAAADSVSATNVDRDAFHSQFSELQMLQPGWNHPHHNQY